MGIDWDTLAPNFKLSELRCKCGCGMLPHPQAVFCLQKLRNKVGPLIVLSAARCEIHNKNVGGAPGSEHLKGNAFDLRAGRLKQMRILHRAYECGFNGIGVYKNFIHVDVRLEQTYWLGDDI